MASVEKEPAAGLPPTGSSTSALSPLRIKIFRNLWLANLVSNLGTWMQDVSAGWLMATLVPDPFMVSLVQVSWVLPAFLLTLPAGALADIVDRRSYMLFAILWMAAMAGLLGVLTVTGQITPWLLIAFTFGLGVGMAMMWPAFSALVPDLVPRKDLVAAVTANSIAMNLTRAIGPAIAGALIAASGPGPVFLLNALSFVGIFIVILRYRSMQPRGTLPSERFIGALRSGFNFARQSPALQTVMIRGFAFFTAMSGMFAFLPLIVREEMGAGPQTYGWLLTSMGTGAVITGLLLARIRSRFSNDAVLGAGTLIATVILLGLANIRSPALLAVIMFLAGAAWISVVSTLQVSAQLSLPAWVRARGLAIYIATFMGSMAVGSASWGRLASATSTTTALTTAAGFCLLAGWIASRWRLAAHSNVDHSIAQPSTEPSLTPDRAQEGPVMVNIEYSIKPEDRSGFESAMRDVRRMRLKNGASAWGLYRNTDDELSYMESFIDLTWLDHLRRAERITVEDLEFKRVADAYHCGDSPPKVSHFVTRGAPKRRRYWLTGKLSE